MALSLLQTGIAKYKEWIFQQGEKTEHELGFRLTYPIRVITLGTGYKYQDSSLKWTTDVNFNAGKADGRVGGNTVGVVTWDTERPSGGATTVRKVGLELRHPTLPKVATLIELENGEMKLKVCDIMG